MLYSTGRLTNCDSFWLVRHGDGGGAHNKGQQDIKFGTLTKVCVVCVETQGTLCLSPGW